MKLIPDPFWAANENEVQWIEERAWEYRATFAVSKELLDDEHVELVADGLDTVATVFLNGREVARTENMFVGYRRSVKSDLRRGKNEILIRFDSAMDYIRTQRLEHQPKEFNDPVGRCSVIRKEQCQFGWDWGPRLVTAGIWRDIRLEGWNRNRLESVRVSQDHRESGAVVLTLEPELTRSETGVKCRWRLLFEGTVLSAGEGGEITIDRPELWWPSGQGEQPLYLLEIEVSDAHGEPIGEWVRRIGLRTIKLDRHADEWGETFQFVVNGRPIFAKGANWIPAHSFVADLTRADYERDLRSAVDAHMNMIRVWGGGIYESEDFYDLCDELGLLVWQDFMFACTLYPFDVPLLKSVREEAEFQVRRLRHRASLALWCGNNEIAALNIPPLEQPVMRAGYEALFRETLPEVVRSVGPETDYWPSSPWRGDYTHDHATGERRGDTHFWDVWPGR
ncbi:MAG TPA: glycoside hydrolase family 2 protein, partial [Opitutus sp.]|nr:glycoside hydrolase family 2 protein [Opitutus sp.]